MPECEHGLDWIHCPECHAPVTVPNAIDTLRRVVKEHRGRTDGRDALADVEALLQAAERTAEVAAQYLDTDRGDLDGAADALAAAVRNVKGEP